MAGWLSLTIDPEAEVIIKVPPSATEQVVRIRRPLIRGGPGHARLGRPREIQILAPDDVKIGRSERQAYVSPRR